MPSARTSLAKNSPSNTEAKNMCRGFVKRWYCPHCHCTARRELVVLQKCAHCHNGAESNCFCALVQPMPPSAGIPFEHEMGLEVCDKPECQARRQQNDAATARESVGEIQIVTSMR